LPERSTVVLFGDSNTWGYVPGTNGERFPRAVRWPCRLADALGAEWDVIAEGLNGRTATIDSPWSEGRNGLPYLLPCLQSHAPVDVLVIYLGTNDVNPSYGLSEQHVARCVGRLVRVARAADAGDPHILVVCPPPFDGHALGPAYAEMCEELGVELLDLDGIASYDVVGEDVEHLGAEGHAAVAKAVEERLRRLA
jgi:lysophospholipase L1-like esterase